MNRLNKSTTMKQLIANALLDIDAVGFSPESPVTFTSGIKSPVYVDNRLLVSQPDEWHLVIDGFKECITRHRLEYDLIAGVAVGGVPHSSALAYSLKMPSVFIRSTPKQHGKRKRIEGGNVSGKRVLLVEDLVTTGGSCLDAVTQLRGAGARVTDVLAIISYRFPEAESAFAQAELKLHTLTDFDVLLESALERGDLEESQLPLVRRWFADPQAWGKALA